MSAALLEDPAEFIAIGRCDWYVTGTGGRLHWAEPAVLEEHAAGIAMDWAVCEPVRLACGRTAGWLGIPGVFSRMSVMRCTGCCRVTGLPEGKGSPKNDPECRKILGLH